MDPKFLLFSLSLLLCSFLDGQNPIIQGELMKWHKITLQFDGPETSETSTPNPFSDYRLEVTFINGSTTYTVPGYYAADGNANETSAVSGNKWKVHFAPDEVGTWNFTTSFRLGEDIAINSSEGSAGVLDGITGDFTITDTNKSGRDHRAKGRLEYVEEHYLRFAGNNEWFYKIGADAPENTLAYEDFDNVPNQGNRRKSWSPHQQDYSAGEASSFTWQGGKGTELLGVVNYLSSMGVNAFSFLTFSLSGDDKNVFPHLLKVDESTYNGLNNSAQWNSGVHKDRFDVSRLGQWERIFEYADMKGIYLHFKTQETENDHIMDGGDLGRERKLYYRELISRFSHHLALNWNLGEENTQSVQQAKDMAVYFYDNDPYRHNVVLHTYPGQYDQRYSPLLGSASKLTGLSIQTSNAAYSELFGVVANWVSESSDASKKWVVAVDEPGNASKGIDVDPSDLKLVREKVVWGTMFSGGAGVEFYYGYQTSFEGKDAGDLDCQNHRSRETKYQEGGYAVVFFEEYLQPYLPNISNSNEITNDGDDYAFTNNNNMVCVYRPNGGATNIDLDENSIWNVKWYNPRNGVMQSNVSVISNELQAPDNNDWVALITADCLEPGIACDDNDMSTYNDVITEDCGCEGEPCLIAGTTCDDGNPDTMNDVEDGNCNCAGIPDIEIKNYYEAEKAIVGSEWTIVQDSNACDGFTLLPPDVDRLNSISSLPQNLITFYVDVPSTDIYKFFARVKATNDKDDSFYVRVNNGEWVVWNKINYPYNDLSYNWHQVANWSGSAGGGTPMTFALDTGRNIVEFSNREKDTRLDKLFVTREDLTQLFQVKNNLISGPNSLANMIEEVCPNGTITFDNSAALDTIDLTGGAINIDKSFSLKGNGVNVNLIIGDDVLPLFINNASIILKDLKIKGNIINNHILSLNGVELEGQFENNGILNILPSLPVRFIIRD